MTGYIPTNYIRLAVVKDIDYDNGLIQTEWLNESAQDGPNIPIPHPYAGKGGEGIFVGPKRGTIIALSPAAYERWIPVFTVPIRAYYGDISSISEVDFEDVNFPSVGAGEIAIQGNTGSILAFTNDGNVQLTNSFREGIVLGDDPDRSIRCEIDVKTPVHYDIGDSGLSAKGIVRRDIRLEVGEEDFNDFLTDISSEQILEEVGWHPAKAISYISHDMSGQIASVETQEKTLRNPAFVENRNIVFEFGRQWYVEALEDEEERFNRDDFTVPDPTERRERRSNVLSLSLDHPNELFESVQGTLVDIFGNLLDINRNVIPIPTGEGKELLNNIYENARHTIALHMELNSRKGWEYREGEKKEKPSSPLKEAHNQFTAANNSRDRSKWSIDVDKEGLTKINIPASSETGNIPRLTRYETSSTIELDDSGNPTSERRKRVNRETAQIYRNEQNRDVFLDQFGPGGIKIKGDETANRLNGKKTSWIEDDGQKTLPENVEAGTAFHDITATARALLKENINKKASDIFEGGSAEGGQDAVSDEINPLVPTLESSSTPNAGGRSVHINLDGNLESSIGANTVDRVSWVLDTAGALVARLGRDKQGRSAIVHADGYVAIEVGGYDFIGESEDDSVDTRFVGRGKKRKDSLPNDQKRFLGGKVVLRIRRPNKAGTEPDNEDNLIIIDDTGISIQTAGRLNFVSNMDITMKAKGKILLDAPQVQAYSTMPKFFRRDLRAS